MSWRDRLQPASFGNLRFYVNSVETVFGRRGTLHEYAFGDTPFAEDVGRKAREFSFTAYLFDDNRQGGIGDYLNHLNRLIQRIDSGESGELVHPTLGKIIVRPLQCSVTHEGGTGGFETLQLKFIEAGENKFPNATNNTSSKLENAHVKLGEDVITQHDQVVNVTDAPDYQSTSMQDIINGYLDTIEVAIKQGQRVDGNVDNAYRELSKFRTALPTEITDNIAIATRIVNLFNTVGAIWDSDNSKTRYEQFNDVYNTDVSTKFIPSPINTPDRQQEIKNNTYAKSEFKALALDQMTLASSKETFTSSNKVFDRRNDLLKNYNAEIENAGINEYDNLRKGLIENRSAMIENLNQKGAGLPDEKSVTLNDSVSSFALGYELYGDAFRGEEIASNNGIRHPLFLPPQQSLLVLTV